MSYKQLTKEERCFIECIISSNPEITIREIARQMNRSPSTISRELKRNNDKIGYTGIDAQSKYLSRRSK